MNKNAIHGAPLASEPNTADNLLLFDGENELPETERRCLHSNRRNNIALSEQSSQIDGNILNRFYLNIYTLNFEICKNLY